MSGTSVSCLERMQGCVPSLSEKNQTRCKNAAKITFVVVTALALVVAILATLVNFNVLGDPLSSLNTIGQFGSGVLVTGTGVVTAYLAARMVKACQERRAQAKAAAAAPNTTPGGEGDGAKTGRSWLSYFKVW